MGPRSNVPPAVAALPCTNRVQEGAVQQPTEEFSKKQELRSFVFLAIVMAPVLAVIIVGGYGFLVWMFQLVAGPPGS